VAVGDHGAAEAEIRGDKIERRQSRFHAMSTMPIEFRIITSVRQEYFSAFDIDRSFR
jgi:hypothetical protein